jgi:hypothetical protein
MDHSVTSKAQNRSRVKTIALRLEREGSIRSIAGELFWNDERLIQQMEGLHSQAFHDDSLSIFRERIRASNGLHYRIDEYENLLGFFLVSYSGMTLSDRQVNTMFCGPMITDDRVKGTGLISVPLFVAAMQEAKRREIVPGNEEHRNETIVWGIGAVSTSLKGMYRYLHDVNPRPDGSYSDDSICVASALRKGLLPTEESSDGHPFFLKHFFKGRLVYRQDELARIRTSSNNRQSAVFSLLGFEESQGDGILFIGKLPPDLPSPDNAVES